MTPTYYRFVFDPGTGEATISHNDEAHPAEVKYHVDMSEGVSQPYNGYAYRVGRGWRLTDWEHTAIDDPYVKASVLRAIRKEEGPHHPHPHMDWQEIPEPQEPGDRFHYGLPA